MAQRFIVIYKNKENSPSLQEKILFLGRKNKMKYIALLLMAFGSTLLLGQLPSGMELLEKSIAYHDAKGNWKKWQPDFTLAFEASDRSPRQSHIQFDNKKGTFHLTVQREGRTIERIIGKNGCITLLDGKVSTDTALVKKYRLTCERTSMYRDYYTYLYGLPMKLKDTGTNIAPTVEKVTFKGKAYLRMRATYDESVGNDIWYFYFDEQTYALKAYQFYHDESKNDGEYILLEGEQLIDGIKVPKDRTWYYNKADKLLGIDRMVGK